MGKKEKNETKLDGERVSPSERKFRENGVDEKYELASVRESRQDAERVAKGVEKLFPEEKTRVAPVEVKAKGYGVYFKEHNEKEPKEREKREKKERHFKSKASEKRFKEESHERIKKEACEKKPKKGH